MNPQKSKSTEKDPILEPDPFRDPQTIPSGWDVSAFFVPEQENRNLYGSAQYSYNTKTSKYLLNEEA